MVAGLVSFAWRASCTLIAEGLDSTSDLTELCPHGVTRAQGYLLGRPVPTASRQLAEPPISHARRLIKSAGAQLVGS